MSSSWKIVSLVGTSGRSPEWRSRDLPRNVGRLQKFTFWAKFHLISRQVITFAPQNYLNRTWLSWICSFGVLLKTIFDPTAQIFLSADSVTQITENMTETFSSGHKQKLAQWVDKLQQMPTIESWITSRKMMVSTLRWISLNWKYSSRHWILSSCQEPLFYLQSRPRACSWYWHSAYHRKSW